MKIQVLYEDGVLKPIQPLDLKRRLVTVDVPDEEIFYEKITNEEQEPGKKYHLPPEVETMAKDLLVRLAGVTEEVMKMPEEELPVVTKKQLEHAEALEMREDQ